MSLEEKASDHPAGSEPLLQGTTTTAEGVVPEGAAAAKCKSTAPRLRLVFFLAAVLTWLVFAFGPFALKLVAMPRESLVAVAELSGCGLSIVTASVVLWSYALGPAGVYRRHPNRLVVAKTVSDLCLSLIALVALIYLLMVRCEGVRSESDRQQCLARAYLRICDESQLLPACTQLFAFSSEAWFLVILVDLRRSVKNPFYSFASSRATYQAAVWGVSLLTAALLVGLRPPRLYGLLFPPSKPRYDDDDDDDRGDDDDREAGGMYSHPLFSSSSFFVFPVDDDDAREHPASARRRASDLGHGSFGYETQAAPHVLDLASCWMRDHSSWAGVHLNARTTIPKLSLFYGPLIAVYLYAVRTLLTTRQRLKRGISDTFAARVRVAAVSVLTVFTYATYWLVYALLMAAIYVLDRLAKDDSKPRGARKTLYGASFDAYAVWSFHRVSKPWWDLIVWLLTNDPLPLMRFCQSLRRLCVLATPADDRELGNDADRELGAGRQATRRGVVQGGLHDEEDRIDAELRPQANDAMQKEVLYYVTSGIRQAARASASYRGRRDADRPINLKRRDLGHEIIHLTLARLVSLMFVDNDLSLLRRPPQSLDDDPGPSPRLAGPPTSQAWPPTEGPAPSEQRPDGDGAIQGAAEVAASFSPEAARRPNLGPLSETRKKTGDEFPLETGALTVVDIDVDQRRRSVSRAESWSSSRPSEATHKGRESWSTHGGDDHPGRPSSRTDPYLAESAAFTDDAESFGPRPESRATDVERGGGDDRAAISDARSPPPRWRDRWRYVSSVFFGRPRSQGRPQYASMTSSALEDDGPPRPSSQSSIPAVFTRRQGPLFSPTPEGGRSFFFSGSGVRGNAASSANVGRGNPSSVARRSLSEASDFRSHRRSVVGRATSSQIGADIVFVDHKPQTFRRVREHFGVRLEDYVASFRSTQKERFSEGGSSEAFFFYSGDERYMVKTCTAAEFFTLVAVADAYAEYVCRPENKATLLVRLLGAHCLRLYETAFYFLVMENVLKGLDDYRWAEAWPAGASTTSAGPAAAGVFPVGAGPGSHGAPARRRASAVSPPSSHRVSDVNDHADGALSFSTHRDRAGTAESVSVRERQPVVERPTLAVAVSQARFDIKGSWVNRTMAPPRPGQRLTCRHCNRKYTFAADTRTATWLARVSAQFSTRSRRVALRRSRSHLDGDGRPMPPPGGHAPNFFLGDSSREPYDDTLCPRTIGGEHEANVTLKDNDLNYAHRLRLAPDQAADLARQLAADAGLLARLGVMDYSLLLGVQTVEYPAPDDRAGPPQDNLHHPHPGDSSCASERNSILSLGDRQHFDCLQHVPAAMPHSVACRRLSHVVVRHFYYFGVIDILQRWTLKKRIELWWKVHVRRFERDGVSCLPPHEYCARFQAKISELLLQPNPTDPF